MNTPQKPPKLSQYPHTLQYPHTDQRKRNRLASPSIPSGISDSSGMMPKKSSDLALGIASYTPQEYAKLLTVAEDVDDLEPTWEEWLQVAEQFRTTLKVTGLDFVDVPIEMEKLQQFLDAHGLPNNGQARAEYVSSIVEKQQQPKKQAVKKRAKHRKHT